MRADKKIGLKGGVFMNYIRQCMERQESYGEAEWLAKKEGDRLDKKEEADRLTKKEEADLSIYLRERDSSTVNALTEYTEHYRNVHPNKCLARKTETSMFANLACDSQPSSSTHLQRNRCPATYLKKQDYMKASSYRGRGKDIPSPRSVSAHRLEDDPNHPSPWTSHCYNCKQYGDIAFTIGPNT
ncbi:hypothetical protein C0Q70_15358 [Pomacea canaliculata]|uniref:Uncharacterized protein n=1 Tax=Pomacea canaliculata TaxID=400727 RepID=A0A2T7NUL4_POMCA|nr:hypothetical protein C0Q70_15358 [Pomacea canaliculata]